MKILYIEDHPQQADILKQVLEVKEGYQVIWAKNAREGIYQAEIALPDIILMDLRMPEIDGYQAMESLQSHPNPQVATIPIIAISAWSTPHHRKKSLQAGAARFFPKPFDAPRLIVAIEELTKDR